MSSRFTDSGCRDQGLNVTASQQVHQTVTLEARSDGSQDIAVLHSARWTIL